MTVPLSEAHPVLTDPSPVAKTLESEAPASGGTIPIRGVDPPWPPDPSRPVPVPLGTRSRTCSPRFESPHAPLSAAVKASGQHIDHTGELTRRMKDDLRSLRTEESALIEYDGGESTKQPVLAGFYGHTSCDLRRHWVCLRTRRVLASLFCSRCQKTEGVGRNGLEASSTSARKTMSHRDVESHPSSERRRPNAGGRRHRSPDRP